MSIGLPVQDGDEFLEESIESLLAQTFEDFELLISDDASTDRTEEICVRFAKRDPRVRYSRNSRNIGAMRNADLTFELARGQYFRWAAPDEVCEPNMLERLVTELDTRPDVAVCCAVGKAHRRPIELNGAEPPSARMREILTTGGPSDATRGLIRAAVLRQTVVLGDYPSSDTVLLCDLAVRTRFQWLEEPLSSKRSDPGRLQQGGRVPHWSLLVGYLTVVRRAPLPRGERLRCLGAVGRWAAEHWKALARDIAFTG